jgi:hypothetical protein
MCVTSTRQIGAIHDVAFSNRSLSLFSRCDTKQILYWDLTQNGLDIFVLGSWNSVAGVWDIPTDQSVSVMALEGDARLAFKAAINECH